MVDFAPTRVSAAEFLQLPETMHITQLIEGEIVVSPSPRAKHQLAVVDFSYFLKTETPNGYVFVAPMDVWLDEHNVFQPDVFWIAENGACVERDGIFYGAPDLIIEILSPSSIRHDRAVKFLVYERVGVREYWIVDADAQTVEVWVLKEKEFDRVGLFGAEDRFTSSVLGDKTVELSEIFSV